MSETEERCRCCGGTSWVDGARDVNGLFVCLDCLAEKRVMRSEIVAMEPLKKGSWADMEYPPNCYDVDKYF